MNNAMGGGLRIMPVQLHVAAIAGCIGGGVCVNSADVALIPYATF